MTLKEAILKLELLTKKTGNKKPISKTSYAYKYALKALENPNKDINCFRVRLAPDKKHYLSKDYQAETLKILNKLGVKVVHASYWKGLNHKAEVKVTQY